MVTLLGSMCAGVAELQRAQDAIAQLMVAIGAGEIICTNYNDVMRRHRELRRNFGIKSSELRRHRLN